MAREMKDSGVAWIDKIPIDWEVKNIRALFSFGKGLPITKDNLCDSGTSVISYGQIHSKKNPGTRLEATLFRYVGGEYLSSHPSSLVHPGDFIFADTSEDLEGCGNCAYVDADMTLFAGYHTIILRAKEGADNRYFAYLFKSDEWRRQIRERVTGVKLFSVSQKILKNLSMIVPPKNLQSTIANYLDLKCAEIDTVLDKTHTSIEEYKKLKQVIIAQAVTKGVQGDRTMKDSGIIWLSTVPADWSISKIKHTIFPQEKPVLPTDDVITCFRDGVVTLRKNRREEGFTISLTEHGYQGVDVGDLVIHGMDTFAGAIGCSDSRGKTSPVVHVCSTTGNNRYFMYFLRYMAYANVLMDFSTGVRIRSSDFRNFAKLGVFEILDPPLEEQNEIVDYLDKSVLEIEQMIEKKERFFAELESYKKSLIYEYVTGKKEVPQA